MTGINIKPTTVHARIIHDSANSIYTAFLEDVHGPIISAKTLKEVKEEFEKAFNLCSAVRNLRYYTQAVRAEDKNKKNLVKNINTNHKVVFSATENRLVEC